MKQIVILGSTGSIGTQAVEVCRDLGYRILAVAAHRSVDQVEAQAREFLPRYAVMYDASAAAELSRRLADTDVKVLSGIDGLCELAALPEADLVLNALSGMVGLRPTLAALTAGKTVALANKETLVAGGRLITETARAHGARLIPVDSEHTAIFQCLQGEEGNPIRSILLTASGGPFFGMSREETEHAEVARALAHPKWNMGRKISVDSATLMNKGIECIEAMQLFGLPAEKVGALVHPKSQIHGVVEFIDGTAKLLLSQADMRLPAAAAIAWPRRLPLEAKGFAPVEPSAWDLNFSEIDEKRFPCFALAREAGRMGGAYPALLVGADESAVEHFLNGEISYPGIARLISSVLEEYRGGAPSSLDEAVALVDAGRRAADEKCKNFSGGINS